MSIMAISNMNETSVQTDLAMTAEIKLYYDLYIPGKSISPSQENHPDGEAPPPLLCKEGSPWPLVIAVHGYGAHKRHMMREARLVANEQFVIASIQGPHQHYRRMATEIGFGWLSDYKSEEYVRVHHQFVLDVIEKLGGDETIDASQVFLYGFSQACALNFRFAFSYPDVLRGIIGVCGSIPSDLETNENYKPFPAETFYLYGDDDEFYTQEKFSGFDTKLSTMLPNYRSKHYTAKHEITNEMREDTKQFLARQIERNV